jgi:hypothetical protein
LSKNEVAKAKQYVEKELFWQKIIAVSSTKKIWIKELFKELSNSLEEK